RLLSAARRERAVDVRRVAAVLVQVADRRDDVRLRRPQPDRPAPATAVRLVPDLRGSGIRLRRPVLLRPPRAQVLERGELAKFRGAGPERVRPFGFLAAGTRSVRARLSPMSDARRRATYALFFVSGAAGLVYEVVWSRL